MSRKLHDSRTIRFAICGALATALVAGCAGSGHLAKAGAHVERSKGKATVQADRAVANAEHAVLQNPRDVALRAALGSAYLDAGRFESAATTFQDAIALGDGSASTALRLALAQIGCGRGREAVVILDMHRDAIPAGDLGLAMALAGETSRGVGILVDALRAGDNTAKLRQNLAYAFALDGQWMEARQMASQDVPADRIDARLGSWAVTSRPEDYNRRVASLLGAPVRADSGQPVELALGGQPAAEPTQQVEFAAAPAPSGELPAVAASSSDPSQEFVLPEAPVLAAAPTPAPAPVTPASFSAAFAEAPLPMVNPVRGPVAPKRPAATAAAKPLRNGSHHVQLGSFSSPENAQRAVKLLKARHPVLKGFQLTITPAVVRGKNFWRVSAAGFSHASAFGMCSTLRTRGGACIAYSSHRPLPGAVPVRGKSGPSLARR